MKQRVCVRSVFCVPWSRPPSFILLKTYNPLYGFRDATTDLHLAEHKWVKRNYKTEQSPFINPPRCIQALTISPGIVQAAQRYRARRWRASESALMAWVIKHYSRWRRKKREKQVLIWKCLVLLFLKAFICVFFFFLWAGGGPRVTVGEFIECSVISVFFLPVCVCVCASAMLMYVSNLVSCRIHMRRQESHISDKVQPIKYNSWLLQCPWIVVITLVLVCV